MKVMSLALLDQKQVEGSFFHYRVSLISELLLLIDAYKSYRQNWMGEVFPTSSLVLIYKGHGRINRDARYAIDFSRGNVSPTVLLITAQAIFYCNSVSRSGPV